MTDIKLKERYIQARRRIIEGDFQNLNSEQRAAVMATEGPLLILAGAGSGKTTVIINRIANLIRYGRAAESDEVPEGLSEDEVAFLERYADFRSPEDEQQAKFLAAFDPVPPWRIIAITFTNKAAGELKDRLHAMLGPSAEDVWASTFHSACVRILRRDIARFDGFSSDFTIYDTADCLSLVKKILRERNLDEKAFPPRSLLGAISRAKDAMLGPELYAQQAEGTLDVFRKRTAEVYLDYTARMRAANALDFDDLILYTVRLLQNYEEVREYYQKRFLYVLVDEYQDTNDLQYKLVSLLAGGHNNLCVVGDDDQGIYKFRGATIENILSFEKQFKNTRVIRLEQNYRSTGNILDAANAVIRMNVARKGKELWTKNQRGEKLTLYRAASETEEAQYVAARICEGVEKGAKWSDFAVLYRINAQSNQMEYALKRAGIPYKVVGGMKFFDRAEIKDVTAYLCVLNNPDDDLRMLRIINTPPRGIGARTIEELAEIAVQEQTSVYQILRRSGDYPQLARSAAKLHAFLDIIEQLRESELPLDALYDTLLEKSRYIAMLEEKDTPENATRLENIQELKSNIKNYMKEHGEEATLAGFLDEISLYTDTDQLEQDADCAVLMTIHSAKGLEFPTVFLIGAEEGIFPGLRSIGEPEEIEEERRLCYVAMTRAKEKLYITAARQRMLFGRTSSNRLSRFVEEIPEENIEKPAETPPLYSVGSTGGYGSGRSESAPVRSRSHAPRAPQHSVRPLSAPATGAKQQFQVGNRVRHKSFGEGTVLKVSSAGGDALLEIAFDTVGTKRLMKNFAEQFMEKI